MGELLTADHIDSKHVVQQGVNKEKEAFAIKDVYSGLFHMYACRSKTGGETSECIYHFVGKRALGYLYSDNSGEIIAACEALGIHHEGSQTGVPHTNAIIDGRIRPD